MQPLGPITAAILVIGDEILSGRTKDKNIGYIAEYLTNIGIDLREVRVVPDIEAEIVAALDALRHRYTYVFTTGGIGPTHDDITADCVAKAFGVSIDVDPRASAAAYPRAPRLIVLLHAPDRLHQRPEPLSTSTFSSRCSVTRKVAAGLELQPCEHVRGRDRRLVAAEHLVDRVAGHVHALAGEALAQQVRAAALRVRHQHVAASGR